ncbi:MAG: carbohydrate-binding family 9-like protein [Chitinophagaceae bacterium]|nr:carbohydrate-binding family 9-like protein [Chitinophagaceae bacterium]
MIITTSNRIKIVAGFIGLVFSCQLFSQQTTQLPVKKCADFEVNGKGDNKEWNKTGWVYLTQIDEEKKQETRFKIMYSNKGIYVLMYGDDEKVTSPYQNDFETLFKADVFEVFFHPNPGSSLYFEYEISPLNKELVLLISNKTAGMSSWKPWHYEGQYKTRKAVFTEGAMQNNSPVQYWIAEVFFPYALLNLFDQTPPKSGTVWNANFCRLDYDSGKMIKWSWSPIQKSFHEFEKYRSIRFE